MPGSTEVIPRPHRKLVRNSACVFYRASKDIGSPYKTSPIPIIKNYKMKQLFKLVCVCPKYPMDFNAVFKKSDSRGRFMCLIHVYNSIETPTISKRLLVYL